ncbi:MAG TPA: hypothetical protein VJK71_01535 [Gemmatimonadales bacterium]|nr:hypothetical protein [Gemmatimonadales bacterium]
MRRVVLLLVAISAVPAAIHAQACIGQASWSAGSIKAGGSLEVDGGTTVLGGLGLGKDEGFFFGAGAGFWSFADETQFLVTGGVGKELSTKLADKVAICPVANLTWGLPKNDFSFQTLTGGLSGGYPLSSSSENLGIVLTGAFQLGFHRSSFLGDSHTDFIGIIDAGAGFILNQRISLSPLVRIYFGDGSDVAFVARANVALGK